ncbi:hypothetical protein [Streptomyces sp. NBC_01185]|uniref:hypothetical protein n=1 Tax=Streptomyces sp. NBC_01185 TaxID=2903764 RepID=UPI00386AC6C6|nr:hypothetical protein OG770_30750 [Streptomyces sp. NBC_01185]
MGIISALASGPAKRWTALISGGAYAFTAVAVLLLRPWQPPAGGCRAAGPTAVLCDAGRGEPLALAALGVLAVVAASGASLVVTALAGPLVHLLSGTALPVRGPVAALVARGVVGRMRAKQRLTAQAEEPWTSRAAAEARRQLHRRPVQDVLTAPTRIGDSFAAMGERILGRHRLDAQLCWPLLQQVFDEPARRDLERASDQVLGRARNLVWAALTVVTALPLALLDRVALWPAALAALAGAVVGALLLAGLGDGVDDYADTVEAALLRHRDALYAAASWPLPADTGDEKRTGDAFTAYLRRTGHPAPQITFERPPPEEPPVP